MKLLLLVFSLIVFSPTFGQDCNKSTIYFRTNKHHAKRKSLEHIDSILATFHPDTTYLLEIHGHTDSRGSEDDNLLLAHNRIQFMRDHVYSKKLDNVQMISKNFGELSPASDKNKENRRVNIFTIPINSDGTITIPGSGGNIVKMPSQYFNHCGYCLAKPEIKMRDRTDGDGEVALGLLIESNCEKDIHCYSVEFRFPYNQFNSPSKIKVPRQIYIGGCGSGYKFSKDSIDPNDYDKFQISYDTITDEYVVTHDCFYPGHWMCCAYQANCRLIRLHLPDTVYTKKTSYFFKYKLPPKYDILYDSTIFIGDTNYFEKKICNDYEILVYGLGFIKGELLFLKIKYDDLHRVPIFDERNMVKYFEHHVYVKDYKPLEYLGTTLQLKVPWRLQPDSVGYYITELDHFIPIEHFKRRRYRKALLDFTFDFGVYQNGKFESFEYTELKKRYRKRRKLLKVKVKRKNIKELKLKDVEE